MGTDHSADHSADHSTDHSGDHSTDHSTGCRHTLVVHGDGTHECEGEAACGADALVHEWWVACEELACGCAGEAHVPVLAWAA